ncbi:MAG: MFS transporter [Pseudomonadales bacterium]|jgi:Na+/melibiose symporter-like transporter
MEARKLGFDVKLAFGLGQAGEGLKNGAFGTFLIFYYVQALGMSGALAGTAVGLAVIVDAITDPLAGSLSDHWKSPYGRRHPFMYASIFPLSFSFYFLFNPLVSGETALFIWLVVFTNLTRTSMSLYHVPHIALGAEMTENFNERSELVSYRMFFSSFGVLTALALGSWVFFVPTEEFAKGQLNAAAYPPWALLLAVLIAVTIFWSAWGTRSVIPDLPKTTSTIRMRVLPVLLQVFRDMYQALQSKSFRWLFAGVFIVFVMVGVDGGLNLFIFTYFWDLPSGSLGFLLIAYHLGVMVGAPACPWFFRRWGKKAGLIFGGLSWPFWQTLPVVLRLLGWFPENGDALLVPLLIAMRFIQGACTVQANVAFGSMVADIVDEHEYQTGHRQEGIFFAASSFSAKATSGIGNIISGFALSLINWPIGPEIKTADDVPPETLVDLGLVYGPYVAAFGFVSIWCYTHYTLTRERHEEILVELAERRGTSSPDSAVTS